MVELTWTKCRHKTLQIIVILKFIFARNLELLSIALVLVECNKIQKVHGAKPVDHYIMPYIRVQIRAEANAEKSKLFGAISDLLFKS